MDKTSKVWNYFEAKGFGLRLKGLNRNSLSDFFISSDVRGYNMEPRSEEINAVLIALDNALLVYVCIILIVITENMKLL